MTHLLTAIIVVLQGATATQSESRYPVIVVDDPQEVRNAVGFQVDGTFTPSQEEAEAPSRDLARYLESEGKHEKSKERRDDLRRIGLVQGQYLWHCGGYKKHGQKNLFCSFVRRDPSERLRRRTFPVIKDGGIAVCRCYFNIESGRIVRLDWNGEA
jgi:hypothetical protein